MVLMTFIFYLLKGDYSDYKRLYLNSIPALWCWGLEITMSPISHIWRNNKMEGSFMGLTSEWFNVRGFLVFFPAGGGGGMGGEAWGGGPWRAGKGGDGGGHREQCKRCTGSPFSPPLKT